MTETAQKQSCTGKAGDLWKKNGALYLHALVAGV